MDEFHDALERRLKELSKSVQDNFDRSTIESLRESEQAFSVLESLRKYIPKRKKPMWLMPVIISLFAMSVVGLASSIRLNNYEVHIDAQVKAITLNVGDGVTEFSNSKPINVDKFEAVGPDLAGKKLNEVDAISVITLLPNTKAIFSMGVERCVLVELVPTRQQVDMQGGIKMVLLAHSLTDSQESINIRLNEGGSVRFCLQKNDDYLLLGRVADLEISRVHLRDITDSTGLRTSSIIAGELLIPSVNRVAKVGRSDRVSMRHIKDGWLMLFPGESMRIVFSGKPEVAELVGLSPDELKINLAPTLLEWFVESPSVRWLFSIITGLVGVIWSCARYLGWSLR